MRAYACLLCILHTFVDMVDLVLVWKYFKIESSHALKLTQILDFYDAKCHYHCAIEYATVTSCDNSFVISDHFYYKWNRRFKQIRSVNLRTENKSTNFECVYSTRKHTHTPLKSCRLYIHTCLSLTFCIRYYKIMHWIWLFCHRITRKIQNYPEDIDSNLLEWATISVCISVGQFVASEENRKRSNDFRILEVVSGIVRRRTIALSRISRLRIFNSGEITIFACGPSRGAIEGVS